MHNCKNKYIKPDQCATWKIKQPFEVMIVFTNPEIKGSMHPFWCCISNWLHRRQFWLGSRRCIKFIRLGGYREKLSVISWYNVSYIIPQYKLGFHYFIVVVFNFYMKNFSFVFGSFSKIWCWKCIPNSVTKSCEIWIVTNSEAIFVKTFQWNIWEKSLISKCVVQ